jgi:cyclopropane-fatty-acyl-phospholipid synthase
MFEKEMLAFLSKADIKVGSNRPWDIRVHDKRMYRRVALNGSLGLGEAYQDGWWDTDDLPVFFFHLLRNRIDREVGHNIGEVLLKATHWLSNLQSKSRAFIVGEQHYDLGNDLYEVMLDRNMIYTCGYWKDAANLDEAQINKLRLSCEKLKLEKGMRVLDIGCGWGGFAEFAAREYGVSVVGVTVSKEQAALAEKRCEGLPVEIRLMDYRDIPKEFPRAFDRIVSLGMFEHVGPKNYRTYLEVARKGLKDDGLFLLHTIGGHQGGSDTWIHKYIFPGGVIPSPEQVTAAMRDVFVMEDWHNFGNDYAKTLEAWRANFNAGYDKLKDKYDNRFYRTWNYYLASCEAGFRARRLQLWQIVLSKEGVLGGYDSIRF